VRAKLRNVTTGAVTDETFRPEEKFGKVRIERTEAQLLYKDGENYVVMDNTTYDQITLSPEQLGSGVDYSRRTTTSFSCASTIACWASTSPRRWCSRSPRPSPVQGGHRQRIVQARGGRDRSRSGRPALSSTRAIRSGWIRAPVATWSAHDRPRGGPASLQLPSDHERPAPARYHAGGE